MNASVTTLVSSCSSSVICADTEPVTLASCCFFSLFSSIFCLFACRCSGFSTAVVINNHRHCYVEKLNTTTTVLRPFFRDHQGEPVPEENFWTLWCKGRLTEADTPTIRLGATPSGLSSFHLHHPPIFYRPEAGCPSCRPTNSVKALKAGRKT